MTSWAHLGKDVLCGARVEAEALGHAPRHATSPHTPRHAAARGGDAALQALLPKAVIDLTLLLICGQPGSTCRHVQCVQQTALRKARRGCTCVREQPGGQAQAKATLEAAEMTQRLIGSS